MKFFYQFRLQALFFPGRVFRFASTRLLSGMFFFFCAFAGMEGVAQSNHTVVFSNAPSDFNALEKIPAGAGNTDYYITFDQDNLYIGAFRTSGNFAATDNLAVYFDTDPQVPVTGGNGSVTGMGYNGVTPTLPFRADYNVYAEEGSGQINQYAAGWSGSSGAVYSAGSACREIKIPFASLGNPYALNLTLWMGNAGSLYSNAPGTDMASSPAPVIADFFGTFGIRNGTLGGVNPVNVLTSPATGYQSASTITGGSFAYVDVMGTTTINGLTLAPGGVINVNAGKSLVLASGDIINNTAVIQNTKSTLISVSGSFTNQGRAYCAWFNVNDGGTYTHDVVGSVANGAAADWPGTYWRTYGAASSVNIKQWAQNTGTAVVGIPGPTSGGWGNVAFNLAQSFNSTWNQQGAFNHVGGDLVMNNIGTQPKNAGYLTFNPNTGDSVIDIGGNFEMNTPDRNGFYLSLVNNASRVQVMNVHGDFIVKGRGHIKFGYHATPAVINYWGNYVQTGGEIKSASDAGTWITINSRGIGKTISVSTSASFNTNYIHWVIAAGAVIGLASDMYFFGDDITNPSNVMVTVNGRLNCNGYAITDEYFKSYFTPTPGTGKFILADGGTLGIGHANGITASGSGLIGSIFGSFSPDPQFGNIQISDRTFSTKANYIYNGSAGQVTGSGLPGTVNSLIIDNSGAAPKAVSLTNDVVVTSLHEIDQGIFSLGAKNVTLHSGLDTTATFGKMGTGSSISYGTGRYLVERYINTGTGEGRHGKSWQFLSTPADGETIFTCWQEGGSAASGYGTWITDPSGTGNGFDAYSLAPSVKTYVPAINDWAGIGSTGNLIANPNGYFLFVRGDRTATAVVSPATPTTLRIKGKLFTGDQPPVSVPAGSFQSIGNPLASQVDFQKIYALSTGVDNTYYAWDPSVTGTYGVGGYQTLSGTTGFLAVPGSSANYDDATSYPYIQSGQAFFVHNSGAATGSVEITEDCKEPGSRLVNRAGGMGERQFLFTSLLTSSDILADGNAVAFDPSFSNKLDENDAVKIRNAGENFGLARFGKILAVEAHLPQIPGDTLFYDLRNLKAQDYSLVFVPRNMDPEPGAFLIDQYLKTESGISLSDSTRIHFSVTSDPASSAAGRFMVVFRPSAGPLALTFISVTAYPDDQGVQVHWQVVNETAVKQYEMERSSDGIHFSVAGTVIKNSSLDDFYNSSDNQYIAGDKYYRIAAIFYDGQTAYSPIVHVFRATAEPAFAIYPNPVKEGKMTLQLIHQPPGSYRLRLLNSLGEIMLTRQFTFGGGSGTEIIETGKALPSGVYHLQIKIPGGGNRTLNIRK